MSIEVQAQAIYEQALLRLPAETPFDFVDARDTLTDEETSSLLHGFPTDGIGSRLADQHWRRRRARILDWMVKVVPDPEERDLLNRTHLAYDLSSRIAERNPIDPVSRLIDQSPPRLFLHSLRCHLDWLDPARPRELARAEGEVARALGIDRRRNRTQLRELCGWVNVRAHDPRLFVVWFGPVRDAIQAARAAGPLGSLLDGGNPPLYAHWIEAAWQDPLATVWDPASGQGRAAVVRGTVSCRFEPLLTHLASGLEEIVSQPERHATPWRWREVRPLTGPTAAGLGR